MSSHGGTVVLMEKTKITVPNGMRDLVFEEVNAEKRLEDRLERLFGALGYKPVRRRLLNISAFSTAARDL